jgi:hypothetical protein
MRKYLRTGPGVEGIKELILNTSELARKWIGDPTTPLNRLSIEIQELQEGWGEAYVEWTSLGVVQ